jgi:signal transduction histidine kinase
MRIRKKIGSGWKSFLGSRGKKQKVQEKEDTSGVILMKRMVSHNVRMPMSVIRGYGELLKRGLLSEEEKENCISVICENITYMNQCLSMVFDEDRDNHIQEEIVDLVELSCKMKSYVEDIAKKIPIHIDVPSGKQPLCIKADTIQIMKIYYQLFENAFKYVPKGGRIQILVYPVEGNQIMVVFKDNGNGLSKEEMPYLFNHGFRGGNSVNKPGNGFGLYTVKQLVEQYNGTISISGGDGNGFSVVMMFPAV